MNAKIGTGDSGQTSLFSGKRVSKADARIETVGTIDELQSVLGMVLSAHLHEYSQQILENIPHLLLEISGEIVGDDTFIAEGVTNAEIEKMDDWIAFFDNQMPELRNFILLSGIESARWLNMARAITRRIERRAHPLMEEGHIRSDIFIFLNRLSRLFFSVERWEKFRNGEHDNKLERGRKLPGAPKE